MTTGAKAGPLYNVLLMRIIENRYLDTWTEAGCLCYTWSISYKSRQIGSGMNF